MRDHLGAERADLFPGQPEVDVCGGAVGDVDDGAGEGFVEGGVGVGEAGDACEGAEGGFEGVAEGEGDVFGGVVVVDCWGGGG